MRTERDLLADLERDAFVAGDEFDARFGRVNAGGEELEALEIAAAAGRLQADGLELADHILRCGLEAGSSRQAALALVRGKILDVREPRGAECVPIRDGYLGRKR